MTVSNTQEAADRVRLDGDDRMAVALDRQKVADARANVGFPPKIYLQFFDEDGEPEEEVSWCADRIRVMDVEYVISDDQIASDGYLFLGRGGHGGDDGD